jgi:hypothetical protein
MEADTRALLDREWAQFYEEDLEVDWEQDCGSERPVDAAGNEMDVSEPREGGTVDGGWVLPLAMVEDFDLYLAWREAQGESMAGRIEYNTEGLPWANRAMYGLQGAGFSRPDAYAAYTEWVSGYGAVPVPFDDVEGN